MSIDVFLHYCTSVPMRIMKTAMFIDVFFFTAPITAPLHLVQQLQDQPDLRKYNLAYILTTLRRHF